MEFIFMPMIDFAFSAGPCECLFSDSNCNDCSQISGPLFGDD